MTAVIGYIETKYDNHNERWTATASGDLAPHVILPFPVEGEGDTLLEALTDLQEQLQVLEVGCS